MTGGWVLFFVAVIFLVLALLFWLFWFGWKMTKGHHALSPYTGRPLRRASEISYYTKERILRYLTDLHQFDNQIFRFDASSFCRETGRIFQNSITWYDAIKVDWNFLQKRHPGNYVSWGSLGSEQQDAIRAAHTSLEGFQTSESSRNPSPRAIEPEFAYSKPGPLYVNLDDYTLLGWKEVPGTELEVLIVQKPYRPL